MITPMGNWLLGAADATRDVARRFIDYDAGKVDDLKERIGQRPYWQGQPAMLDRSLDFLAEHELDDLASVTGLDADIVLADELVSKAVRYNGDPTIVIGKVESSEDLPGDNTAFGTQEVSVAGSRGPNRLVLGVGGTNAASVDDTPGTIVMVRGVVVAHGRRKAAAEPVGTPIAYFAVVHDLEVDDLDARVRPYLRRLRVKLPKPERTSRDRDRDPVGTVFP